MATESEMTPMTERDVPDNGGRNASRTRLIKVLVAALVVIVVLVVVIVVWTMSSDDGKASIEPDGDSLKSVEKPPDDDGVEIVESGFGMVTERVIEHDAISFGMVVKNHATVVAQGVDALLVPKSDDGKPLTDESIVVTVNAIMPGKEMAVGTMIEESAVNGDLSEVADISVSLESPDKWWDDDGTFEELARTSVMGEPNLKPQSHGRTYITFVTAGKSNRGGVPYIFVAIFRDANDEIAGACFQEWGVVGARMNIAFDECFLPKDADKSTMKIYADLMISELHHIPGSDKTKEK